MSGDTDLAFDKNYTPFQSFGFSQSKDREWILPMKTIEISKQDLINKYDGK